MFEFLIFLLRTYPAISLVWETPPDNGQIFHNHYVVNSTTVLICNLSTSSNFTIAFDNHLQLLTNNTHLLSDQLNNWFTNFTNDYNKDAKVFNQTKNYRISGTSKKVNFPTAFNTCRRHNANLLEFTDESIIQAMEEYVEESEKNGQAIESSRYLWTPVLSNYIPVFAVSRKQIPPFYNNKTIEYRLTADTCTVFDIKEKQFLSRNCNTQLYGLCFANIQPFNMFNKLVMFNRLQSLLKTIQRTTKLVLGNLNSTDLDDNKVTNTENSQLFHTYEQQIINNSINFDNEYFETNIPHLVSAWELLNDKVQLFYNMLKTDTINTVNFLSPCCETERQSNQETQPIHYKQRTETSVTLHTKKPSECQHFPTTKILPLFTTNVFLSGEYIFFNNSCFKLPNATGNQYHYYAKTLVKDICCHNLLSNSFVNCTKQLTYPSFIVKNKTTILISSPNPIHIESTCIDHSINSSVIYLKRNQSSRCTFFTKYPFFSPILGTMYTFDNNLFIPHKAKIPNSSASLLELMIPYLAICSSIATVLTCLVSIIVIYYKSQSTKRNSHIQEEPSPIRLRPILKTNRRINRSSSDSDDSNSS